MISDASKTFSVQEEYANHLAADHRMDIKKQIPDNGVDGSESYIT